MPLGIDLGFDGSAENDIYLGTTNPPPFWGTTSSANNYPIPTLQPNAKYYWKVVARNVSGSAASAIWSFTTSVQAPYSASIVAGNGQYGSSGDGGPALQAALRPTAVAVDRSGNIYIADAVTNRVRMVDSNGIITTVAGSGSGTDSGDGGPAVAAINGLNSVAVDAQGNLYLTSAPRIRKVAPDGTISTLAGNGTAGYSGDGGPATAAQFDNLQGVALDAAGNVVVADCWNNCIRKISSGIVSQFAGQCGAPWGNFSGDGGPASGASFAYPVGVAVDSAGNVFIADSGNARIRKVSNGVVTTIAGGGSNGFGAYPTSYDQSAVGSGFNRPAAIAVDGGGSVLFTSVNTGIEEQSGVYRISNGVLTVIAGDVTSGHGLIPDGQPATDVMIWMPLGACDSGGRKRLCRGFRFERSSDARSFGGWPARYLGRRRGECGQPGIRTGGSGEPRRRLWLVFA